jgi:SNF2 family DNA or RNA helicase
VAWAMIERDASSTRVAIGCSQAEYPLCEQIPGCNFGKKDSIWRFPLTWPGYVAFMAVWSQQPIEQHPELLAWREQQWATMQAMWADRLRVDADADFLTAIVELEHGADRQLDPAQRGGAAWLARWGRVGYEDPTGNGKTGAIIRALQLRGEDYLPALIIAPSAALLPWKDKIAAWAPELDVSVIMGPAGARRKALEAEADVYLIAWDNLRLHTRLARYPGQAFTRCTEHGGVDPKITVGRCEVHPKELNEIAFGVVVADEAHRMADARTKWTRAVWQMAHDAQLFWAVTATKIRNSIADPWPVMYAIDPAAWPSRSRFLDLYAVKEYAWGGGTEILGIRPDTEPYLRQALDPYWRLIPKEIARPDRLAPREPEFRYPEMTPAQQRVYKQLKKETEALVYGKTTVPANAAVKFGRMCQVSSAMIELADGEDDQGFTKQMVELVLPSNKITDLIEFLGDNEGQLVVAANSPKIIELAERKLGEHKITSTKIVGGMGPERCYAANQMFLRGDVRVIFINQAGSESIDLQCADTIFWLQPNPSRVQREQIIGRIDRWGQTAAVRQVHCLSHGSAVDLRLYQLGCEREERASAITRDAQLMTWCITASEEERAA